MARIVFTPHLAAVAPTAPVVCDGDTLAELLDAVGADYPRLKGYVLDDHGRVRQHIAIFVNGLQQPRQHALSLPLRADAEVYVFQALSGG